MSDEGLHETKAWRHLSIALSILSVVVVSVLLIIESTSFYRSVCGKKKETSPGTPTSRERVENSSDVDSQETTTNIDFTQTSRSTSSIPSSGTKLNRSWTVLHVLPLIMYILYFFCGMVPVLFKLIIPSLCEPCGVKGTLFGLAKLMMYLVFIYRLHAIYKNTAFEYSTTYLSSMAIICVLYNCVLIVVNMLTVSSVSHQIGDKTHCGCAYVMLVPGAIFLADTIVSAVCCCAFIKPLKALQALDAENRDADVQRIVVKYMTLTCVALISTMLIMFVIAGLMLNELAALDIIINSMCVFLMNKENDLWFKYLCFDGKCGAKVVECCCKK